MHPWCTYICVGWEAPTEITCFETALMSLCVTQSTHWNYTKIWGFPVFCGTGTLWACDHQKAHLHNRWYHFGVTQIFHVGCRHETKCPVQDWPKEALFRSSQWEKCGIFDLGLDGVCKSCLESNGTSICRGEMDNWGTFWLLSKHGISPCLATLPDCSTKDMPLENWRRLPGHPSITWMKTVQKAKIQYSLWLWSHWHFSPQLQVKYRKESSNTHPYEIYTDIITRAHSFPRKILVISQILQKCKNSAAKSKFCSSAQNSAAHGKLWP